MVPRPGRPSWPPAAARPSGRRPYPARGGLEAVQRLVRREAWRGPARRPLLVVVTDGRATGDGDALAQARKAAAALARAGTSSIVVDAEDGPVRLGLAGDLAGT